MTDPQSKQRANGVDMHPPLLGRVHGGNQPAGRGPAQSLRLEAGREEDHGSTREQAVCLWASAQALPPDQDSLSSTSTSLLL